MSTPPPAEGGTLMCYNLATFKQDVRNGAKRALRDFFSPGNGSLPRAAQDWESGGRTKHP